MTTLTVCVLVLLTASASSYDGMDSVELVQAKLASGASTDLTCAYDQHGYVSYGYPHGGWAGTNVWITNPESDGTYSGCAANKGGIVIEEGPKSFGNCTTACNENANCNMIICKHPTAGDCWCRLLGSDTCAALPDEDKACCNMNDGTCLFKKPAPTTTTTTSAAAHQVTVSFYVDNGNLGEVQFDIRDGSASAPILDSVTLNRYQSATKNVVASSPQVYVQTSTVKDSREIEHTTLASKDGGLVQSGTTVTVSVTD